MTNKQTTAVQKYEPTFSERFTSMVVKEFGSQVGTLELSPYQQRLAKHLFIGVDKALTDLEAKRIKDNVQKSPIVWANVNMQKLAIDAVHRIELGLDALIPNHIHTVPYFNSKLKKYDLDLSIGYVGKDYCKRKLALDPPRDIVYQLVRETDEFIPIMKDSENKVESYKFKIKNPFNRGNVIGGFGYIIYEDETKNKLVMVDMAGFKKSETSAKTATFWKGHPDNMMMVVVVRRTTDALKIDPKKVNASYAAVELDENHAEINANANQEIIDIDPEPQTATTEKEPVTEEEKPETVYLTCPTEIDKKQPRKSIEVCQKCKNREQCNAFAEWALDNQENTGDTENTGDPDQECLF